MSDHDRITVLVADDEAIVRHGVRLILDHADGIEVVGEAADGKAAIDLTASLRPDVVLMDIRMPEIDGIEATRRITAGPAHVLILTTYDLDENLYLAMRAGACGFLLKTSPPDDLVHAVRVVARGDAMVEPVITRRLLAEFVDRPPSSVGLPDKVAGLSAREREVLQQMTLGRSNAEIASALFLSEGTVKSHVASILSKLGVRDRVQAVIAAFDCGFARPGGP
ncbi:response regulator [Aquihabitans sp. McL0605]|uniref:response regulator n=1 Tax=Aquihabitans sp. McL0605 TaxID=3415671 RepID=UPI003CEC6E2B